MFNRLDQGEKPFYPVCHSETLKEVMKETRRLKSEEKDVVIIINRRGIDKKVIRC